jgi:outer membrane protein assembly factor BamA
VALTGLDALTPDEQRDLQARLPIAAGDPLDYVAMARGADLIVSALEERGHARARVDIEQRDAGAGRVRVVYHAVPGAIATFGPVTIFGNARVSEDVIRREITFAPGAPFRRSALLRTQREIDELPLIDSVAVAVADRDNATATEAPIHITVVEGDVQQTGFSIGYGTEEDVRAEVQWRHLNVFGGARALQLHAKWSSIDRGVEAAFLQPYLVTRRLALSIHGAEWRIESPAFAAHARGATGTVAGRVNDVTTWSAAVSSSRQRNRIDDEVLDAIGGAGDALRRLGIDPDGEQRGVLNLVTLAAVRSTVPAPPLPAAGYEMSVRAEHAGSWASGTFRFVGVHLGARHYQPVGGATLASRLELGVIDPLGSSTVPLFKRYFLGGVDSLRGWGQAEITPVSSDGAPVGGLSVLLGSSELRFPIAGPIGGAVFVDLGDVRASPWRVDLSDLLFDAGGGLRYDSPFGRVRVDMGYQLTPRASPFPGVDAPGKRWRLHFSIGESF